MAGVRGADPLVPGVGALGKHLAIELQELDARQGIAKPLQLPFLQRMEKGEGREPLRAQTQGSE